MLNRLAICWPLWAAAGFWLVCAQQPANKLKCSPQGQVR